MKNGDFQGRVLATLENLKECHELQRKDVKEIKDKLDVHLQKSAVLKWMTGMLIAWCAAITGIIIKMVLR